MQNGVTWTIWNEMKDGESSSLQVSFLSSPTETLWRGVPEAPSSLLLTPAESDLNSNPPFWPPPPRYDGQVWKRQGFREKLLHNLCLTFCPRFCFCFFRRPGHRHVSADSVSEKSEGIWQWLIVGGFYSLRPKWRTSVSGWGGGGVEVLFPMSVCGGCEILSDSSRRRSGRSWS